MLKSERQLVILAALVRLIPACFIYGTEDVSAWHRCGALMAAGKNPYDTPLLISWPPLWPVLAWFSYTTSEATGVPFAFVVKLFPIAADVVLTIILLNAARKLNLPRYATAAAYAFNPVAIYTSAIHGNFDSIPALFLTLSVLAASSMERDPRGVRAGAWLGIGAAFKTWPLLMLPGVIASSSSRRRQVLIAATSIGIFLAALLLPWPIIGRAAIESILRYRGFVGWWGITAMEFLSGHPLTPVTRSLIFYGAMGIAALIVFFRKTPAPLGALFMLLTFYLATPGFGLQYLLWIVPIAILADRRRALLYSAVAGTLILVELVVRPYTGYIFESIRFLPHRDFARNYGGPIDQRYTSEGRLILWVFFAWWWVMTLIEIGRGARSGGVT